MANRNNILQDSFEQIAELGTSTITESAKAVAEVLNPVAGVMEHEKSPHQESAERQKRNDHTPLNFDKLGQTYGQQDAEEVQKERKYLNRVHEGHEKAVHEIKQEDAQRKQQQEAEAMERLRQEQAANAQAPAEAVGKAPAVLGGARKKANVDVYNTENKPSKPQG